MSSLPSDSNLETDEEDNIGIPFDLRPFTKEEAARIFKVTVRTIETWLSKRLISHRKLGGTIRITGADIREALDNHHVPRRT